MTTVVGLAAVLLGVFSQAIADPPKASFLAATDSRILNESALDDFAWIMRASERRRPALHAVLQPIFRVLAKSPTDEALLGPNGARYALHRVFVQRHGWQLRGLEPGRQIPGDASVVHTWITAFIQRRRGAGVSLSDMTELAAMIEEHVHQDSETAVDVASNASAGLLSAESAAIVVAKSVKPRYEAKHIQILTQSAKSIDSIIDLEHDIDRWEDLKFFVWLRDVQMGLAHVELSRLNPFVSGYSDHRFVTRVVDEVQDSHGRWQNLECKAVKNLLVELDTQGVGRVQMKHFYQAQLDGVVPPPFQFTESETYLRRLGALDETDPRRPGVMVPNYLHMRSNCIKSTDSYEICCVDECEALLGKLEAQIESPSALPEEILAVVVTLPSETVVAPRSLSPTLILRLNDVAKASPDGHVALHGRLFAQWLHYAFPYECAYPHAPSSEEMLQTPDAWLEPETLSLEAVRDAYAAAARLHATDDAQDGANKAAHVNMLWNHEEVAYTEAVPATVWSRLVRACCSALPFIVLASALSSMLWWAWSNLSRARCAVMPGRGKPGSAFQKADKWV